MNSSTEAAMVALQTKALPCKSDQCSTSPSCGFEAVSIERAIISFI